MNNHEKAGLIEGGINYDGEQEYIGTDKQWQKFAELEEAQELMYGKVEQEVLQDNLPEEIPA